jgi:predicted dehydrogenase
MGTRRLRDLSARNDVELAVYDSRPDRLDAAKLRFNIPSFNDFEEAMAWKPQALCISTPPDQHDKYIELALRMGLHHFCEANIWTMSPEKIEQAQKGQSIICAPSNSLYFLPTVKELRRIVREELGSLHSYQLALNTYCHDWHPGEGPEFYARKRNTSAGREMVPFEMLYLLKVFGKPVEVDGRVSRLSGISAGFEDTWSIQIKLESGAIGQFTVMHGCPGAFRRGCCFGDHGQVAFDLFAGVIERSFRGRVDDVRNFGAMKDVLESAYAEEINTFVDAILGRARWPQSYGESAIATATLAAAEASALKRCPVKVDAAIQPQQLQD